MKILRSLNNPGSWQVTDDGGTNVWGYIDLSSGQYRAFGSKLHHGKGGMRKDLGYFTTLDHAVTAIKNGHSTVKEVAS